MSRLKPAFAKATVPKDGGRLLFFVMKTLKFTTELCEQILCGVKTATWRLFDDKDLPVGDELQFINKETGNLIGGEDY
jgi:hypothetical protein